MAKEKRDKDAAWMAEQQMQAAYDKRFTETHDFMTENPATEVSSLAPHRVKPYHFKGLNAAQKQAIMDERENQLREAEMLKANEKEAEKLLAMQAEQQRRQQVLADREYKRKLREMQNGVRATQEQQKTEHDWMFKDPYNEKGPGFSSK